jgi:hypothetical protein
LLGAGARPVLAEAGRIARRLLACERQGRRFSIKALSDALGGSMSHIALPSPDLAILQRRNDILKQLKKLAPGAMLITDQEGRRTFETDALTAYRCLPLAVVLP